MILVIGGIAAGKRDFVMSTLGYTPDNFSCEPEDEKPVFHDLHELIRREGELDDALLSRLLEKEVVICNEIGSGVVPLDRDDRDWRENVGRACVYLAAEAGVVVRVVCGIPQWIKGGPSC